MLKIPHLKRLNRATVTRIVREFARENAEMLRAGARFSRNPERPYGRNVLHPGPGFELLLTGWARGRTCWPHTHGPGAKGIVLVISGKGTFSSFPRAGDLRSAKTRVLSEGQVVYVPENRVHSMGNNGTRRLVCLHAYWPPIESMKLYNPKQTDEYLVSEGGAWKPESKHILKKRKVRK